MKRTIFYCWQSDRPVSENKDLIESALHQAIGQINKDRSTNDQIELDQDIKGNEGTPDIPTEIFKKIKAARVVVCDLTIVGHYRPNRKQKPLPNPNVQLELGYAVGIHDWKNVICLMNTKYGQPEKHPFDHITRFKVTYSSNDENPCSSLAEKLEKRIREILQKDEFTERQPYPLELGFLDPQTNQLCKELKVVPELITSPLPRLPQLNDPNYYRFRGDLLAGLVDHGNAIHKLENEKTRRKLRQNPPVGFVVQNRGTVNMTDVSIKITAKKQNTFVAFSLDDMFGEQDSAKDTENGLPHASVVESADSYEIEFRVQKIKPGDTVIQRLLFFVSAKENTEILCNSRVNADNLTPQTFPMVLHLSPKKENQ